MAEIQGVCGILFRDWSLSKPCERVPRNESKTKPEPLLQTSLDQRFFWCGPKCHTWLEKLQSFSSTVPEEPWAGSGHTLGPESRFWNGSRFHRGCTGTEEVTHLQNKLHFNKTIHNINCGFLFFSIIFPFTAKEFNYKESVPAETIECLRRNPWSSPFFFFLRS